jgi:uncharacterized protein (TIGR02284 family)
MHATICHLSQALMTWLQDLIQLNLDSRDGFSEAADTVQPGSSSLATMFLQIAGDRAAQARELQEMIDCNVEPPRHEQSVLANVHREWMNLRDALGNGEEALLAEAERGESHLQHMYEEAMVDLADCECFDTIRNHYLAVRASHERIRETQVGV